MGDQAFSFSDVFNAILNIAGGSPFSAMLYVFVHGGWIIFIWLFLWAAKYFWLEHQQTKSGAAKEWILLRISVPRNSEQTPRAVENMFAHLAGMHTPFSWTEIWIQGLTQTPVTVEIASLEGKVSFYAHSERRFRIIIESSIYAQYPDADIEEVEDYTKLVPDTFPNEEYDAFVTELIQVKPDPYPIRTYFEFEDKVSGEFKDPMSGMLENMAQLGPGEYAWYQIVATATDQKAARKRAEEVIDEIKGVTKEHKKTVLDEVVDLPLSVASGLASAVFGGDGDKKKEDKKNEFPKLFALSPGERTVLESLERKAAKVGFMCKIRFAYIAKKHIMKKARAVHPFIGAIKQVNTFDMQALKPESKLVGNTSNFWWFKKRRNDLRKTRLIKAYRKRSNWRGLPQFLLSIEELATLWHFPIFGQVKAPQLLRTEAKKSEPPANIPFG